MNSSITTDSQLARLAQTIGVNLNGIYPSEMLKNIPFVSGKYIINLGNAHWVALNGDSYFDSFGFIYPLSIRDWAHPKKYNHIQIQAYRSGFCGQYCLMWLKYGNEILKRFEPLNRVIYSS